MKQDMYDKVATKQIITTLSKVCVNMDLDILANLDWTIDIRQVNH